MTAARRRSGLRGWLVLAALGVIVGGCSTDPVAPQDVLAPAGPVARAEDDLWNLVFPIAVVVFVLVQSLILFSAFRFRRRKGDDDLPKQVHGNTRLELVWTVIPALVLAWIAVPTVGTIFDLSSEPDEADRLDVTVIGKQYWWEFEYPEQGIVTANELHIPVDTPVYLSMESYGQNHEDPLGVIHSFWVPRLAGKQDVVPGHTRYLTIQADEPGTYSGQCAEFCGLSHARMRFVVVAQTHEDYDAWLDAQSQDATVAGNVAAGAEAFSSQRGQCIGCHAISGVEGAQARVGPDLTHFASREVFAGGILENTDDNVAAWLRNPPQLKPGAQMPNLQLDEQTIADLTAYLRSLK